MYVPISFSSSEQVTYIWNIHDYQVDDKSSTAARRTFHEQVELVRQKPLHHIVLIQGDFNRTQQGMVVCI